VTVLVLFEKKQKKRNLIKPPHIAAHLQALTSQRSKTKGCKRAAILPPACFKNNFCGILTFDLKKIKFVDY
jgi:hypothetical protein